MCKGRWIFAKQKDGGIVTDRKYNKGIVHLATKLRRNMTKEERHLWYDFLRTYPIKFIRQKTIGKYIVDFYSPQAKLVIELDGSGHYTTIQIEKDTERTQYLSQYDLTVIRLPNNYLNQHFQEACEYIDHIVQQSLSQLR